MRFGATEMLMVVIVIMIIVGATRFFPLKSRQPEPTPGPARPLTAVEARDEEILRNRRRSKIKFLPFVLVIIGILLILSAQSFIKYFFMSYVGGALIILVGLASLFLLSRRS
jgi:hypothetical protein